MINYFARTGGIQNAACCHFQQRTINKNAPKPFGAQVIETTYIFRVGSNARHCSFLSLSLSLSFGFPLSGCPWVAGLPGGSTRWPPWFVRIWVPLGGLPVGAPPPREDIPLAGGLFGGMPFNGVLCGICVAGCCCPAGAVPCGAAGGVPCGAANGCPWRPFCTWGCTGNTSLCLNWPN